MIDKEEINDLQYNVDMLKGISVLTEIYNEYKTGSIRELDQEEKAAAENFLATVLSQCTESIKTITDVMK